MDNVMKRFYFSVWRSNLVACLAVALVVQLAGAAVVADTFNNAKLDGSSVILSGPTLKLRVVPVSNSMLRLTFTTRDSFLPFNSYMVLKDGCEPKGKLRLTLKEGVALFSTADMTLKVDMKTGGLKFFHGNTLLADFPKVELKPTELTRNKVVVPEKEGYSAKLHTKFADGEAIYGLGQHEEGFFNYRGHKQYLYQHNLKVAMPVFLSSKGYGVFLDTYAYSIFDDTASASSNFWTEAVDEFDFYFIYGPGFDKIIAGVRKLTGAPTLFPKWVFGYVQSKERYKTQQELIDVVDEYRKRGIPLDCIVQDWRYWPKGWGYKKFDQKRFPDMKKGIKQIHDQNVKFMISIWPLIKNCPDQKEMKAAGCMLGGGNYNPFIKKARDLYWEQTRRLFAYGVDAWWCDCTEPVDADWGTKKYISPEERAKMNTDKLRGVIGNELLNAYSLFHCMGIYNHQMADAPDMRVVDLTRSAYPGQQRYGAITWSGDLKATWEVLKKEIAEGVSFCVSGDPKWTLDTGAFFVGPNKHYFRNYDGFGGGCKNKGYRELYTRWLQFSTFLPMTRSHGTSTPREVWRFGEPGGMFYDTLVKFINFRYRMLPYIYSNAAAETFDNYTMTRMLPFDFRTDPKALQVADEFMFGPALLVAPVTKPLYYDPKGKPLPKDAMTPKDVYLPGKGEKWFDFWTGETHPGGGSIKVETPIAIIPIFARAGSILPLGPKRQYAYENEDKAWELRIYPGADASFKIYEDDGISNKYLNGERATFTIAWNDKKRILSFSDRKGKFPGMVAKRQFKVVVVSKGHGVGVEETPSPEKTVEYDGKAMDVRL